MATEIKMIKLKPVTAVVPSLSVWNQDQSWSWTVRKWNIFLIPDQYNYLHEEVDLRVWVEVIPCPGLVEADIHF